MATILSVREMIDSALGASDANVVNFKMIQNVLHVLAQQLRVLERRVELRGDVAGASNAVPSASNTSINITEVRVQAAGQGRKKEKPRRKDEPNASGTTVAKDTILVVERRVSPTVTDPNQSSRGRISVVTQAQFARLEAMVNEMQEGRFRFSPAPRLSAIIPINEQAIADIRSGVLSLPDAMTALQVAARIEATERGIERLSELVTEIAANMTFDERVEGTSEMQTRIEVQQLPPPPDPTDTPIHKPQTEKASTLEDLKSKTAVSQDLKSVAAVSQDIKSVAAVSQDIKSVAAVSQDLKSVAAVPQDLKSEAAVPQDLKSEAAVSQDLKPDAAVPQITKSKTDSKPVSQPTNLNLFDYTEGFVTEEDLEVVRTALQTEMQRTVTTTEQRLKATDDLAMNRIRLIEDRLSILTHIEERMDALERIIHDFEAQLNSLDTGLSSQMTYLQEQINELQSELEVGLQQAMEGGGGGGGDATGLADLNARVANLTAEAEAAAASQQALESEIKSSINDLHALLEQIEVLKESKVDREELADALRDKADARALNGMVSEGYFEAVRGQLEDKQRSAADKFSQCELVWQKVLDDLHVELNEKAEVAQMEPLRDHLDSRLLELQARLREVALAAGEPRAAGISRQLQRDGVCIACTAPAVMLPDSASPVPLLPPATLHGVRPPVIGAETSADEAICYADWPKIEQRGHVCHRYCGGSHTLLPTGVVTRQPFPDALKVMPAPRRVRPTVGTDGHLYITEEPVPKIPCVPCNVPHPSRTRQDLQSQPPVPMGESMNICWVDVSSPSNVIYSVEPTLPALPNY